MSELLVWTAAAYGLMLAVNLGVTALRFARAKAGSIELTVSVLVLGSAKVKVNIK